jgi:tetratricopeptide (TPR) repeat protein
MISSVPVAAPGRPVFGPIAVIALIIVGLSALDKVLAKSETAEVEGAAERSHTAGKRLLAEGKAAAAIDPLRNAHALVRQNAGYELELIGALLAVQKTSEADPLMEEILVRQPNDGQADLMAGRLRLREGRVSDAEAYYHRAIYGEWQSDAAAHRTAARLELIQLLIKERDHQNLLAELISLEAEAGTQPDIEKELGHLFMVAGSPARAAGVYHALLAREPDDATAYAGLGEAELEQGQYRAARGAFLQASYRHPDAAIQRRLELLYTLTALDPTPRQLPSIEKYNRSLQILEMTRADLERQIAQHPALFSGSAAGGALKAETDQLLSAAAGSVSKKTPQNVTNEMAEDSLGLAEKIWKARIRIFGTETSPEEEPLRLIMEKLAA